jgi:predicted MPP superfamily phosphohydrolase
VALGGGLTACGYYQAVRVPPVKRVHIPLEPRLEALDGFSIAQLSDLHITRAQQRIWLEQIVGRVNDLHPDIIVLTGDLADGHVSRLEAALTPLRKLQAPYGRYFVTGNHEYYWGHRQWMAAVERLGFTVMLNTRHLLRHRGARLLLAGVPDYNAGRFDTAHHPDPAGAMGPPGQADFSVLLAHQPKSIFKAAAAGFDLQLSGHTHGGQFFPWMLAVGLVHPFIAGLNRYGRTWIYTSRGTGYWGPPLRLGAPAEITQVILSTV